LPPLEALVSAGLAPAALLIPAPPGMATAFRRIQYPIPGSQLPDSALNLLQLATRHEIPIHQIGDVKDPAALSWLESLSPDLIITACFPFILPPEWLDLPRLGALNLHPSLLPAYRGPQPLFWQLWNGERNTGVTLHWMDVGVDTGDIAAQARVDLPDGVREAEADGLFGRKGGELLVEALQDPDNLPRSPQPAASASYQPAPGPADLVVPADWPARRVFNFMRGAEAWGPFFVRQPEGVFEVSEAVRLAPASLGEVLPGTTRLVFPGGDVYVKEVDAGDHGIDRASTKNTAKGNRKVV